MLCCLLSAGAIIAVEGSINDEGFYCGCFQGKRGLVPAGFVQEMEVEDSEQRKRLLNQTLSRPHLPSFSHYTSPTSSRPASATLLSPSGSMLTHTPFLHRGTGIYAHPTCRKKKKKHHTVPDTLPINIIQCLTHYQ